ETDPGQLLHALGVVIFGGQLGALPDPTQVVQQRRIVSAETCTPRRAWTSRASVAQLQRVRHHPHARGTVLRIANTERFKLGVSIRSRARLGSSSPGSSNVSVPARYAFTTR